MSTFSRFGALDLPVPAVAPGAGETVGDPTLDVFLAFAQAVITFACGAAWTALAPLGGQVVRIGHTHNPGELSFNTNHLPMLFAWRGDKSDIEAIADDIDVEAGTITLLWVFPKAAQENQRLRKAFSNAVGKSLSSALKKGRHEAWTSPGDPEEQASYNGSFFWALAGLWSLDRVSWQLQELAVMNGTTESAYPSVMWTVSIKERVVDGTPDSPAKLSGQTSVPDGAGGQHTTNEFRFPKD